MDVQNAVNALKAMYDKIAAGCVLVLLAVSLVYLGVRLMGIGTMQNLFSQQMAELTPEYPEAEEADMSSYAAAAGRLENRAGLPDWDVALFVPETRCWCVDSSCRRPIPITAEVCPFCRKEQPKPPLKDMDGDGMLDDWEDAHELNAGDPSDADRDPDDDGFTNLEEFMADPQTDPRDQASRPPIVTKLHVIGIEPEPFGLLFKSRSILPGGLVSFAINPRRRKQDRTYFKELGETVEGFKLETFEEKFEEEKMPGGWTRKKDVSVLTLSRGKKLIPLTLGRRVSYQEWMAELVFDADDSEYSVRADDIITLAGTKYKVIRIDGKQETVVIQSENSGQLDIRKRR